eukprot:1899004-Lingulodinium_polyedra.AAC.1
MSGDSENLKFQTAAREQELLAWGRREEARRRGPLALQRTATPLTQRTNALLATQADSARPEH